MRLLVVEDEQHLAEALGRGLGAEGFAVDLASNGTDGLWMAREHPYDAILLDILLPGMNGFAICRTLREEGNWTPILMLTAKDGELDEAECLDTGADDFLSKPFSFVVLVARVRALVRRGVRARPAVLRVGNLSLDPGAHRVWVSVGSLGAIPSSSEQSRGPEAKEDILLTPREFSLLEYLMRHAGVAIAKHELLDHVWGVGMEVDPNVVEVYVGYLRRKLAAAGSLDGDGRSGAGIVVETIRGVGYRLDPLST